MARRWETEQQKGFPPTRVQPRTWDAEARSMTEWKNHPVKSEQSAYLIIFCKTPTPQRPPRMVSLVWKNPRNPKSNFLQNDYFKIIWALKPSWCSTWDILGGQERLKGGQERPKSGQERPREPQERPKVPPRAPQEQPGEWFLIVFCWFYNDFVKITLLNKYNEQICNKRLKITNETT